MYEIANHISLDICSLFFQAILYLFSMVLADIGLTLGQTNTYLPPNEKPGYDYPKPPGVSIVFPVKIKFRNLMGLLP